MIKLIKRFFKQETGDEMRARINCRIREYNAVGIASIKFIEIK